MTEAQVCVGPGVNGVAVTGREGADHALPEATQRATATGRGFAAVVLAGHPSAFHVRLDGPADRRVAQAMAIEQIDYQKVLAREEGDIPEPARRDDDGSWAGTDSVPVGPRSGSARTR